MTSQLEDRYQELRFSAYGNAVLVDGLIMQRYIETHAELRTVISVVKLRGSKHSRQFRQFDIVDGEILIRAGAAPYNGLLQGQPRYCEP